MSGVTIEFRSSDLRRAFAEAVGNCRNMRPAFEQIGEHMLGSIEETFDAQGRPRRWPRLSMATVWGGIKGRKGHTKGGSLRASSVRKILGKKILTASGRLRRSITYRAGSDECLVGTNVVYGAIHHFGGEAGRKSARVKIPARPYLVIQDEDEVAFARIIENHVGGAFE